MNAILQVENLTKQYADFKLDHVSFSVPKGTIMGLIGENGAGKSTTINAILDLIHKDDGTVTFWGQELSSTKQIKEDVGVVFDGINFYETLTPAKVGKIAGAAYKQWDGHLFQDYLKRFQLPADKEIKSLSKGMKMKLCIAVALSHNPKLLILDEATSGLDPVMRDDIPKVPFNRLSNRTQRNQVTVPWKDGIKQLLDRLKAVDYITSHTERTATQQNDGSRQDEKSNRSVYIVRIKVLK